MRNKNNKLTSILILNTSISATKTLHVFLNSGFLTVYNSLSTKTVTISVC